MVRNVQSAATDTRRKQLWRARNAAHAVDHRADEERALSDGVDLAALRRPAVLRYNTAEHSFRESVLECLGLVSADAAADLAALEGLRAVAQAGRKYRGGDRGPSTHWIQLWLSEAPELRGAHAAFSAAYQTFLRKVVLPHVGDRRGILFQRRPTFRCHVAGGGEPTGVPHRDADNGHPSAEINFWCPLTRCDGSNSLFVESAPGLGDFAPLESAYGEANRFWGAQCMHHTEPNETERTRVSFDFRVVPRSCFVEDSESPGGRADPYRPGTFYGVMDATGEIVV